MSRHATALERAHEAANHATRFCLFFNDFQAEYQGVPCRNHDQIEECRGNQSAQYHHSQRGEQLTARFARGPGERDQTEGKRIMRS